MNKIIYTSPSGAEFVAQSKEWTEDFQKATPSFPIASGLGDFLQDLGIFSPTFAVRFEFLNDTDAASFMQAVRETGPGTITEPDSEEIRTVQITRVRKSKGLVRDVGRTVFEVEMTETITEPQTQSTTAIRARNNAISENALDVASATFAARQNITNATDRASQIANFSETLEQINLELGNNVTALLASADSIVDDPINAMIATKRLIQLPGITIGRIQNKVQGYSNLVRSILEIDGEFDSNRARNNALYAQAMGSNVLNALSNNVIDNDYISSQEAIATAQSLSALFVEYQANLDERQDNGEFEQDGAIQQATTQLIYNTAASLFESAFGFKTEFEFETTELTTIYDIAAKYYPDRWRDDEIGTLNLIADSNDFSGNDFIALDTGRRVVVYV